MESTNDLLRQKDFSSVALTILFVDTRKMSKKERVAVLGASPKAERFSNRAIKMLTEYGHEVFPVNPANEEIEGLRCYKNLAEISESISGSIDTVTVYVGPNQISPLIPDIVAAKPKRVILNPGTESDELKSALKENQIPFIEGCTLVLLRANKF